MLDDCSGCNKTENLLPDNVTAFETWKTLHLAARDETGCFSYPDVLATITALDGSRNDIEKVYELEEIFLRFNR